MDENTIEITNGLAYLKSNGKLYSGPYKTYHYHEKKLSDRDLFIEKKIDLNDKSELRDFDRFININQEIPTLKESGSFKDGKKSGFWMQYDDFGKLVEKGNYENNLRQGEWVEDDGIGFYERGVKEGTWYHNFEYYMSSKGARKVILEFNYRNDLLDGEFNCWKDDNLKEVLVHGQYKNNKKEGYWYVTDKKYKIFEGNFKNNQQYGIWKYWYKNFLKVEFKKNKEQTVFIIHKKDNQKEKFIYKHKFFQEIKKIDDYLNKYKLNQKLVLETKIKKAIDLFRKSPALNQYLENYDDILSKSINELNELLTNYNFDDNSKRDFHAHRNIYFLIGRFTDYLIEAYEEQFESKLNESKIFEHLSSNYGDYDIFWFPKDTRASLL